MEIAIRWSHRSRPSNPRFLVADVTGRTFKLCRVVGYKDGQLLWEEISRNSKVPAFRAFDWSYVHDIVAVGQWSGETTILGLENNSRTLSLPIKSQRQCNAVAFNLESLLATGLGRVRNDHCLNVYDINHWVTNRTLIGPIDRTQVIEPVRKLATSEEITSIKFFPEHPNTLVAGVKGSCVRIYDLRDHAGNPSLQYQTTCVHNLAIDPSDQNYFASAGPVKDPTVHIWDRRSVIRPSPAGSTQATPGAPVDGPILELRDVFRGDIEAESATIWSLRYSSFESGCLGVLGNNGNFRIFNTKKDYVEKDNRETKGKDFDSYVQSKYLHRTRVVDRARNHQRQGARSVDRGDSDRILAFDYCNITTSRQKKLAITLRGNQDIGICELEGAPPVLNGSVRTFCTMSDTSSSLSPLSGFSTDSDTMGNLQIYQPPSELSQEEINQVIAKVERWKEFKFTGSLLSLPSSLASAQDIEPSGDGWNERPSKASKGTSAYQESASTVLTSAPEAPSFTEMLLWLDTPRRRLIKGYLFDTEVNCEIVKESKELVNMWKWIGIAKDIAAQDGMVANKIDFSFLGVSSIWNHDLGSQHGSRIRTNLAQNVNFIGEAIVSLFNSLELPDIVLPKTSKPFARKLCLYTCGFNPDPEDVLVKAKTLALSGHSTEGALHALLLDDYETAITALRSGPVEQQHKTLSMIVSIFNDFEAEEHNMARTRALMASEKDPYARGILTLLTAQPAPTDLPPLYQVGIALKTLQDSPLANFIDHMTTTGVRSGLPSYIPLTGLTEASISLFVTYVEHEEDLSSAVLALSFAVPKYIESTRVTAWRDHFRHQLNTWQLFVHRCMFDIESTELATTWEGIKAIKPPPRQVTLHCERCDGTLHRENFPPPAQPFTKVNANTPPTQTQVLGGPKEGTMCPRCGARLPRCVVCDFWVGEADPRSKGASGVEGSASAAGGNANVSTTSLVSSMATLNTKDKDLVGSWAASTRTALTKAKEMDDDYFEKFIVICHACEHIYHEGHAEAWFAKHKECAAPGCNCHCDELDNDVLANVPGALIKGMNAE